MIRKLVAVGVLAVGLIGAGTAEALPPLPPDGGWGIDLGGWCNHSGRIGPRQWTAGLSAWALVGERGVPVRGRYYQDVTATLFRRVEGRWVRVGRDHAYGERFTYHDLPDGNLDRTGVGISRPGRRFGEEFKGTVLVRLRRVRPGADTILWRYTIRKSPFVCEPRVPE